MRNDLDDCRRRIGIRFDIHPAEGIAPRRDQRQREQHHDEWVIDRPMNQFGDHGCASRQPFCDGLVLGARASGLGRSGRSQLLLLQRRLELHRLAGGHAFAFVQFLQSLGELIRR